MTRTDVMASSRPGTGSAQHDRLASRAARRLSLLKKFAPAALLDKGVRTANKLGAAPKPNQVPQNVR